MTIYPAPKPTPKIRSPKVSTKRVTPVGRSPVKKVNRERSKKEWMRAYGSPERVDFVASLPCIMCGQLRGVSQNVHLGNGGKSRKSDSTSIVPMCLSHHEELHRIGIKSFMAKYRTNMERLNQWAYRTQLLWLDHQRALLEKSVVQGNKP